MIYLGCQATIITHLDADKQPETRDKRETRQEIHPNKGDPIDKWLGTVPLSLENLVDPFKENTSENTPQNSGLPSGPSQFSNSMPRSCTEKTPSPFSVRGSNFRNILGERNVFINNIEPSIELMKRAKEIFIDETFPKMDDSLAKNLAIDAKKLETKSEKELVRKLVTPLILAITEVPVQSLEMSEDKLWVRAINVPLDPDSPAVPITLSRPRPDFVFGYPIKSFNKTRLNTIKLLVAESHENYAMPDEAAIFPFLVVEAKAQAAGGTHFVASNQAAHAGAVAMLGTLELARRISAEEDIDLDQPQFFSISIDYATAHINAHWLCRDTENGAFCFHMRHLQTYLLDADGLKAVNLAVKNILHFGVTKRLANICRDLDTYSQKIKKKAIIDQSNLASNLRPEEQHQ